MPVAVRSKLRLPCCDGVVDDEETRRVLTGAFQFFGRLAERINTVDKRTKDMRISRDAAGNNLVLLRQKALNLIEAERNRQDDKFGVQRHAPETWLLIAVEELGEVSQARLQDDRQAYRKELVQAAAVMVAWLEAELALSDFE